MTTPQRKAPVLDHSKDGTQTAQDNRKTYVTCKGCGGRACQAGGRPHGWYSLSVRVPRELGKNGKPYTWCGEWCSAACLAGSMADLAAAEARARTAYAADLPVKGDRP